MMRALVTGGAGLLGSYLCDLLLSKGCAVTVMDNLVTGDIANISRLLGNPDFEFLLQDVTEDLVLSENADVVFHLASPASPTDYLRLPIETLRAGSVGTLKTLDLARAHRSLYLFASTSEIYGDPLVHPQREDYWGNVNPIGPRAVYNEGKRFAEAAVAAYHSTYGLDTRIARIFNAYGPRMRADDGRVVPRFITQALRNEPLTIHGDGLQTRSFCYVTDLIEGIYRLAQSDECGPVNLGNPDEHTILDFARSVIRLTGSKSEVVFRESQADEPRRRKPDISKAKALLDWQPSTGLDEGLAETIAWFSNQSSGRQ